MAILISPKIMPKEDSPFPRTPAVMPWCQKCEDLAAAHWSAGFGTDSTPGANSKYDRRRGHPRTRFVVEEMLQTSHRALGTLSFGQRLLLPLPLAASKDKGHDTPGVPELTQSMCTCNGSPKLAYSRLNASR